MKKIDEETQDIKWKERTINFGMRTKLGKQELCLLCLNGLLKRRMKMEENYPPQNKM